MTVAGWLREPVIEAAAAGPGNVRDHPIHHLTALLVSIEVLIKKVAEKAPALRDSDSIDPLYWSNRLRIVFEIRKKVADSRKPQAHYNRILCRIDVLIDLSWNKAIVQMDEVRIGHGLAVHLACKAPLTA